MADYVSIDEFNSGWTFFTKRINGAEGERHGGIPDGKQRLAKNQRISWIMIHVSNQ